MGGWMDARRTHIYRRTHIHTHRRERGKKKNRERRRVKSVSDCTEQRETGSRLGCHHKKTKALIRREGIEERRGEEARCFRSAWGGR